MHFCQCPDTCILKQMYHKCFPMSSLEVLYQLGAADRCHLIPLLPSPSPPLDAASDQDSHPLSDTHCVACQADYGADPAT